LTVEPLLERMGLQVAGEINLGTRHVWEAALEPLMKRGTDVYLDLGRVVFSDAAAVAALVIGARRLDAGSRVVLIDPPRSMSRTLELLYAGVSSIEVQGR
jgi:anti-anti-sigma factor